MVELASVPEPHRPSKLDIGCGADKKKGFTGIDLHGDADIVWDLFEFPWPIEDGSVREVFCSHFLEHIPHYRPQWDGVDGWWMFWAELYRICRKGATLTMRHPYVWNDRAFQDPTHCRYIHESNYGYLSKEWRVDEKLDHYIPDVDFEVLTINYANPDDVANRSEQAQFFFRTYYKNAVGDLEVKLKRS